MSMNRTESIEVKVTPKEKKKIREIAQKKQRTMSSYARFSMLNKNGE